MVLGRKHVTRMTSIINTNTARSAKSRPKCPASVDSPRILVIAAPCKYSAHIHYTVCRCPITG